MMEEMMQRMMKRMVRLRTEMMRNRCVRVLRVCAGAFAHTAFRVLILAVACTTGAQHQRLI